MSHNIKKGDIVRCIVDNPRSEIKMGETYKVYLVDGNHIYYKNGFSKYYNQVELVERSNFLIHQKWKDLHDKGIKLEWSRSDYWYSTIVGKASKFNELDYKYRVKDLGYDYYKAQLDKIDLSFMVDKEIVVETYGLISLAQAFVAKGAECGASTLRSTRIPEYGGINNLDKCFGLVKSSSSHANSLYYRKIGYTILSFQGLLNHPDAQKWQPSKHDDALDSFATRIETCPLWQETHSGEAMILDAIDGVSCIAEAPKQTQPKEKPMKHNLKKGDIVESIVDHTPKTRMAGTLHRVTKDDPDKLWYRSTSKVDLHTTQFKEFKLHKPKEKTMNPLDLILLSIFQQEGKTKDATNANHLAILTETDGTYVGYIYAEKTEDFHEVMRKPENESRKLHIFNYGSTIAQKPRKIVEVDRVKKEDK